MQENTYVDAVLVRFVIIISGSCNCELFKAPRFGELSGEDIFTVFSSICLRFEEN